MKTQIQPSPELWRIICEQIYRQHRINQATGKRPIVDVLATDQYADMFHAMLQEEANSNYAVPVIVRWEEGDIQMLDMKYRKYERGTLIFPVAEVNVCIPNPRPNFEHIFAVPNYEAMTYFDFLTNETRPMPKQEPITASPEFTEAFMRR